MSENSYLTTLIIEEASSDAPWFSLEEAASFAASSSALFYSTLRPSSLVEEWLDQGYRKHLRRAKPQKFSQVIRELPGELYNPPLRAPYGRLFFIGPYAQNEEATLVHKLQLSHFHNEEHPLLPVPEGSYAEIILNKELGMSFGKAVVAAAHCGQELVRRSPRKATEKWLALGAPAWSRWGSKEEISVSSIHIKDHGLTEVPPGSITASVELR